MYPGLSTRIAAPNGVTLAGEGLESLGQEPRTKASIFSVARADFRLKITGQGQLPRGPESGEGEGEDGGSGGSLSVIPAAVVQQRWIIYAFAGVILGLGFYGLYAASGSKPAAPSPAPAPAKKRKS